MTSKLLISHRGAFGPGFVSLVASTLLFLSSLSLSVHAQSSGDESRVTIRGGLFDAGHSLSWEGKEGYVYFIQQSEDLQTWEFVKIFDVGEGRQIEKLLSSDGDFMFYRLLYSDDPDSELLSEDYSGSGLSAWQMIQLGYNPFEWTDSTGNRIHDAWEEHFFGVQGLDPDADFDDDEMSNRLEFLLGTNPTVPTTDVIPVSAPVIQGVYATTGTIYIDWEPSLGIHEMRRYFVYRDGSLIDTTRVERTGFTDRISEPGVTHRYEIQAEDLTRQKGEKRMVEASTVLESNIPEPWQVANVGEPYEGQGPGFSSFSEEEGRFVLSSSTEGMVRSFYFVYQPVDGDFSISTRVDSVQATAMWAKAGLAAVEDLTGEGRGVGYALNGTEDAQYFKAATYGGGVGYVTTPDVHTDGWIRIEREGDIWRFSASQDGQNWLVTGEEILELPDSVYVGIGVSNSNRSNFGTGVFSDVRLEINPAVDRVADGDGDGISDFEETEILFSDPEVQDIGAITTVQSLRGIDRVATLGHWAVDGDRLEARDERGWVEYTIDVPEDGIYRLSLALQETANPTNDSFHNFDFSVDGNPLDRVRLRLDPSIPAFAQVITPYLSAGLHTVRVDWENTLTYRRIAILGLTVDSLEDLGWVDHRLQTINGIVTPVDAINESFVSPFLIEGWAKHFSSLTVTGDEAQSYTVAPLPGGYWMAEMDLDAAGAISTAQVSLANGAMSEAVSVSWVPYDLLGSLEKEGTASMNVREGDSILFTLGGLTGTRQGTITITDVAGVEEPVVYSLENEGDVVPHAWNAGGVYQVSGVLDASEGEEALEGLLEVRVFDDRFAGNLTLPVSVAEPWSHPELSFEADVDVDSRLAVTEIAPINGARTFSVGTSSTSPLFLAARLPGEGAVLDTASIAGFRVASSLETSITLADRLPDGTEVIDMPVLVSEVVPGMEIILNIAVSGITFADGSVTKVLTADDFDELGRAYVRFLRSGDASTANCYTMIITLPNGGLQEGGE